MRAEKKYEIRMSFEEGGLDDSGEFKWRKVSKVTFRFSKSDEFQMKVLVILNLCLFRQQVRALLPSFLLLKYDVILKLSPSFYFH